MHVFNKQYLMTAGPTPLPPLVSQVMAEPILYHRAPAFVEIYERVLNRLQMGFFSILARLDVEADYAAEERAFLGEAGTSTFPAA